MDRLTKPEEIKAWFNQIYFSQPIVFTSIAVGALAGCLLFVQRVSKSLSTSSNRLPPGPKGLPFIGSIQLNKVTGMITIC